MWPFRTNPRLKAYLETPAVLAAAENTFFSTRSFARYLLRFSEDQAQRVIDAYTRQTGPLRSDPIETDPTFADILQEVDAEVQRRHPTQGLGQCHLRWRTKRALLKERGVEWLSPPDLNPSHRFD